MNWNKILTVSIKKKRERERRVLVFKGKEAKRSVREIWCSVVRILYRQENILACAKNILPLEGMIFNLRLKVRYYIPL